MSRPGAEAPADLICLSHLRWDFVFQRPQHLMTRCATERRVFYMEEPVWDADIEPRLRLQQSGAVTVVVPHLPSGADEPVVLRRLLDELIEREGIEHYVLWYYTPMALPFTSHLLPQAIVYDCMDELTGFANAPAALQQLEYELLKRADLVFTGGQSLYEAKRHAHANIHPFPSSVDVDHFAHARRIEEDPVDQREIPRPRLGFFGVVDERMDLELLAGVADARPGWQLIVLGQLPHYIAGWDVALLPFARNDATRFISPTKTPEYLAAGLPVVSTSIRDVVRPYGQRGLVRIGDSVEEFIEACEAALMEDATDRLRVADVFLRQTSWDGTWARMRRLVDAALSTNTQPAHAAN